MDGLKYSGSLPATLSEVMNVDTFSKLDVETVTYLWRQMHGNQEVITAVVPADTWLDFSSRLQSDPVFLTPCMCF